MEGWILMRENKVVIDGDSFTMRDTIHDNTLEKINNAIERMKDNKKVETEITFTFAELQGLRRLIILDDISMELSYFNVKEGVEFRKTLR